MENRVFFVIVRLGCNWNKTHYCSWRKNTNLQSHWRKGGKATRFLSKFLPGHKCRRNTSCVTEGFRRDDFRGSEPQIFFSRICWLQCQFHPHWSWRWFAFSAGTTVSIFLPHFPNQPRREEPGPKVLLLQRWTPVSKHSQYRRGRAPSFPLDCSWQRVKI